MDSVFSSENNAGKYGITFRAFSEDVKKKKPKKLPVSVRDKGLKIIPFKTSKQKIKQRKIMEEGTIPGHPSSVIINGSSGSGKTQLVINLLTRPEFYGKRKGKHYFDKIHVFSPTAGEMDDLVRHLQDYAELDKKDIHNEFDRGTLMQILDEQAEIIKKDGFLKSDKVLVLLDDIQSDKSFLKSKAIKKLFLMNRHYNVSTWLCGQSFNLTPRACRLQANNLFLFPMNGSERKILIDEFTPAKLSKKEFASVVDYATGEQYNFLHINRKHPPKTRFRKNLDQLLELKT